MNDWLDDLLEDMPSEPCPSDFVVQVRAQLRKTRRQSRWINLGLRLSMVMASAVGLWLFIPRVEVLIVNASSISFGGIDEWLNALITSPGGVLLDSTQIAFSWISQVVAGLEAEFILALILLATPALYGGASLLSRQESQEGAVA